MKGVMNMQKRITIVKEGVGKNPTSQLACCVGSAVAKIK